LMSRDREDGNPLVAVTPRRDETSGLGRTAAEKAAPICRDILIRVKNPG